MEREDKYLLKLLRAFLLEEPFSEQTEVDWPQLFNLAQIHNVSGILGYMDMLHNICTVESLKNKFRKNCLMTMALYSQRGEQADQLFSLFEENQIAYCPVKGILLRACYPVIELRSFSDVDFLIRSEDRQRSHELMLSLGFEVKNDWEPVYSYLKGTEYYEIHTQLMEVDISEKADYRGFFNKAWEYAQPFSDYGYQLLPEFHFVYLLTHIAKHVQGSGAGIRMYLDIAAYIQSYGKSVNWEQIFQELRNLQLYDFACTVLTCVEHWFNVRCPIDYPRIDPAIMERFQEFTMEAGVFGHYNRESGIATLKKQKDGSRVAAFINRAFPKAENLESRYTYLQGKHWLLPVAWVHRFFKTDISLRKHAEEAKTIFTADKSEITRLQNICTDIGL